MTSSADVRSRTNVNVGLYARIDTVPLCTTRSPTVCSAAVLQRSRAQLPIAAVRSEPRQLTSSDYTNKMRRVNALHDLASVLGDSVSIDTVRRRIDILRNGFKREYKKVVTSTINSTSASDIYVPTLWYYEQMLFLEDSEQAIENSTEYLHQGLIMELEVWHWNSIMRQRILTMFGLF
ncbi:hypothetical protein EVAR_16549_1 [Eumeta japonica]|uniref:MADF domain-containing protein n=1 Tax=Eumeta variegata TaxID=151549 RepID=A0A4C1U4C3_EUMVA|nr:hypothetical protein EVAR_16549_1 [Eumeta japonica]